MGFGCFGNGKWEMWKWEIETYHGRLGELRGELRRRVR